MYVSAQACVHREDWLTWATEALAVASTSAVTRCTPAAASAAALRVTVTTRAAFSRTVSATGEGEVVVVVEVPVVVSLVASSVRPMRSLAAWVQR